MRWKQAYGRGVDYVDLFPDRVACQDANRSNGFVAILCMVRKRLLYP
jgi:hypothetical protein